MITFQVEYDMKDLQKLAEAFPQNMTEAALPNTSAAFQLSANYIRNMWTGYLSGDQSLDGIDFLDKVTSAMVMSIKSKRLGDLNYAVYSDNRQLAQAQEGRKEVDFDMKTKYPYGKKSRVSKKGVPYLIIPFRWGTANKKGTARAHFNNFIPQKMYETSVKGLNISEVNMNKKRFEANFKGESIERKGYDWAKNGRLKEDKAWDSRSVGMVRMRDVRGSRYFTFRIISAKSPAGSWIYHRDAVPGVDMMGALQRTVWPRVEENIKAGFDADVKMYSDN